jgi:hypothetical protein
VGRGDPECVFLLVRKPSHPRLGTMVTRSAAEAMPAQLPEGPADARASSAAARAAKLLEGTEADSAGSVRMFGVRLAIVPASYAGQITFDTMHLIEKRALELYPSYFALVREAAAMGAFHVLGGALVEVARAAGEPVSRDPHERLADLVGIARALGWGGFYPADFAPGKELALAAGVTHESAYYAARHGGTVRHRLAAQQGIALAMMLLLDHVDFGREDPITTGTYADLMVGPPRHHVDETRSVLRGDAVCEVIVEALDR